MSLRLYWEQIAEAAARLAAGEEPPRLEVISIERPSVIDSRAKAAGLSEAWCSGCLRWLPRSEMAEKAGGKSRGKCRPCWSKASGGRPRKTCPRCGEVKMISEFHRDRAKIDGVQGWCKACKIRVRSGAACSARYPEE
jgi:hypothetical protein